MKKLALSTPAVTLAILASLTLAGCSAESSSTTPAAPEAASAEASAPVEEAAAEEEDVPADYKSALTSAETYAGTLNMSKAGILAQLTSEADQFTPEAAQYAVDNVEADWNANALASAKTYQESMAMSPEAIRDQLTSEFGDKFTAEEADYAVSNLNG